MSNTPISSISAQFASLPDPRRVLVGWVERSETQRFSVVQRFRKRWVSGKTIAIVFYRTPYSVD